MGEIRERPILFSGPMVRAILEGRRKSKLYAPAGVSADSPEHLARRLANGLRINEGTGCWEWQRARNNFGYGILTVGGRTRYAHRLAFELAGNEIPAGADLMHSCDNPRCINPAHLSAGTRSRNMADCHRRGRSRIPHPRMRGESNGAAKLTAVQVAEIRRRVASGAVQRAVAEEFGVSQTQISNIVRGRHWRVEAA